MPAVKANSPKILKRARTPIGRSERVLVVGVTGLVTTRARSALMSRVRSKGNLSTEARLARLLRAKRVPGWRRHAALPGTPDFSFRKHKVAVFVDGCFWHGCPACYSSPKTNAAFWRAKLSENQQRDLRVARLLRQAGWRVVRLWECLVKDCPEAAVARVSKAITKRSGARGI